MMKHFSGKWQIRCLVSVFLLVLCLCLCIGALAEDNAAPVKKNNTSTANVPTGKPVSGEALGELTVNTEAGIAIRTAGDWHTLTFTPETSGQYVISSSGSMDTKAFLYDAEWNLLYENDDGGENGNFSINWYLEKGETYILQVGLYSSSKTGSFNVCVRHYAYPIYPNYCMNYSLTQNEPYVYYAFNVPVTGSYTFYSFSDIDTYGYLYDSNWNQIMYDDDSGNGNNFSITAQLMKGNTYYFGARFYNTSNAAVIDVCLEKDMVYDDLGPSLITETANISAGGDYAVFRLYVTESQFYQLRSLNAGDTRAYLFDENWNQLDSCDDFGGNVDFNIVYYLKSGHCYYLSVGYYDSGRTGSFSVEMVKKLYSGKSLGVTSQYAYANECRFFTLQPDVTTEYTLSASGNDRIYIDLYDASWNRLEHIDPNSSSYTFNQHMLEDKIYYVCLYYGNRSAEGTMYLYADKVIHPMSDFSEAYGEIYYGGEVVYYSFTPEACAVYYVATNSGSPSSVTLYDSTWNLINEDVSAENETGALIAFYGGQNAQTYYIATRFCSENIGGALPVSIYSDLVAYGVCGENAKWSVYGNAPEYSLNIYGSGAMEDYDIWNDFCPGWYEYSDSIAYIDVFGVSRVGNYAFYSNYPNLQSIYLSNGIKEIGRFAICCSLSHVTSLNLPSTLETLEDACISLPHVEELYIPASVSCIETPCNLQSVNFNVSEDNGYFCSVNGVLFSKDMRTLYRYPQIRTEKTYTVPNSVKYIPIGAFDGCAQLTDVRFPEGLISIGQNAFCGCSGLTSVVLPKSLQRLEYFVFQNCSNLTDVVIPSAVNTMWVDEYEGEVYTPFLGCNNLTVSVYENSYAHSWCDTYGVPYRIITYPITSGNVSDGIWWEITAPDEYSTDYTLTVYGSGSMPDWESSYNTPWSGYKTQVKHIRIGDGIRSVGAYSFHGFTGTEDVEIAGSVVSIGNCAFCNTSITSLVLNEGTQELGVSAFRENFSLRTVSLPSTLNSLTFDAFYRCTALTGVSVSSSNPYFTSYGNALFNKDKSELLLYPAGRTGSYTVPNGVTEFANYAFAYSKLSFITLPTSLRQIRSYTFYSCENLTSLEIPASVTSIDDYAIAYCGRLESISLSYGIQTIGKGFACQCGIMYITIPSSVETICGLIYDDDVRYVKCYWGSYAVSYCEANGIPYEIIDFLVDAGSCGDYAYWEITARDEVSTDYWLRITGYGAMEDYDIWDGCYPGWYDYSGDIVDIYVEGVSRIGDRAFYSEDGGYPNLRSMDLDYGIKEFGWDAININNSQLTSIDLPATLEVMETGGLYLPGLEELYIPASVNRIDSPDLLSWSSLTRIDVSADNRNYCSVNGVLFSKDMQTLYRYPENRSGSSYTIPSGVAHIYRQAFSGCGQLTDIHFSEGLIDIGDNAFCWCYGLTSIVLPKSLQTLDALAFQNCYNLTDAVIPSAVSEIVVEDIEGDICTPFIRCYDLTVSVYENSYAHSWCETYGILYQIITYPVASGNVSDSIWWEITAPNEYSTDYTLMVYGSGSMPDWDNKNDTPWSDYRALVKHIQIEDGILSVGSNAFSGLNAAEDAEIAGSVVSIGQYAFENNTSLTSLVLHEGTEVIDFCAFEHCQSLRAVSLPSTLNSLGYGAFYGCEALTSVSVSASNPYFCSYDYALYDKAKTTLLLYPAGRSGRYIVPDGVVSLGDCAFAFSKLSSVTLPDSLSVIGAVVFGECDNLTSLIIPASVESIGEQAIRYCDRLSSISLGYGLRSIGVAFGKGCPNLTTVTIPSSVQEINGFGDNLQTIVCYANSYAVSYCQANGIPYAITEFLADSGSCGDNAYWDLYAPNEVSTEYRLVITGSGAMDDYDQKNNPAPWTPYKDTLISADISGVTTVGESAFYECRSLEEVTLHEGITGIGMCAFYRDPLLTEINFPSTLTQIAALAINCEGITDIYIPAGVSYIGEVLNAGENLESITVADENPYFCSVDGVLFTKDMKKLMAYPRMKSGTVYVVPEGVEKICMEAFASSRLTEIILPEGLKETESNTFLFCKGLVSVTLPESFTALGFGTFQNCYNLREIYMPAGITYIDPDALLNCSLVTAYVCKDSYAHTWCEENGVDYAFIPYTVASGSCGTNAQWKITAPDTVSTDYTLVIFGNGAMTNYSSASATPWYTYRSNIRHAQVQYGITSVGAYTFYNAPVSDVFITNTVTEIGKYAFYSCKQLTEVTLPENLSVIRTQAFGQCGTLSELILPDHLSVVDGYPATASTTAVMCNCGTDTAELLLNKGYTHTLIHQYQIQEPIPATASSDGISYGEACNRCGDVLIESVTISHGRVITLPAILTEVEEETLMGIRTQQIVVPDGVDAIGSKAFAQISDLVLVLLPDSITFIADDALQGDMYAVVYCSEDNTYVIGWCEANGIWCVTY